MMFGSEITDILRVFAPALVMETDLVCRVIACRVADDGSLVSAVYHSGAPEIHGEALPRVNHFVIGAPVAGRTAAPTKLTLGILDDCIYFAWRAALRGGWSLKPTDSIGDCGIDAMAFHEGGDRTQESWALIRCELADFIQSVATDPAWQQIFSCCCELTRADEGLRPYNVMCMHMCTVWQR